MEVYIEYVVLDNLIINTLILILTKKTLNLKSKKLHIALASLLGTVFAVFMPFIAINNYLMFFLKMLLGFLLSTILYPTKKVKQLVITYLWFLTYTFTIGGLCFGIAYLFGQNLSINGLIILGFEVPMSIFVLIITIYIYLLLKTVSLLKKGHSFKQSVYSVIIKHNNKTLHTEAFLDTGNRLYDNGQPVVIISPSFFNQIFSHTPPATISDCDYLQNPHYMTAKSVTENQQLLVFTLAEINILTNSSLKKFKNIPIGVAKENFNTQFDCLLHQDLF